MKPWIGIGLFLVASSIAFAGDPWRGQWIWDTARANIDPQPVGPRYFRQHITLDAGVNQDHTLLLADDRFVLYVNGKQVLSGSGLWPPGETDLSQQLHAGANVIAIEVVNEASVAGLYFESNLKNKHGELVNIVSDDTWRTSGKKADNWTAVDFDDSQWKRAVELGNMGIAPWGKREKLGDAKAAKIPAGPVPAEESVKMFTTSPGFEVRVVAQEPEVINPVAMAIDDKGRLFVSEAHTYRWGKEGSPVNPPTNPIVMLEVGADGKAHRKTVVAQGYEDPVMGLAIRGNKIWIAALNKLFVADIQPDGTAGPQKLLVEDVAKPWNPFGFYRVAFGPDGYLYLIVGDHEIELVDANGKHTKTRGPTGALFRGKPDGTDLQLLIQGMRAPFSFDFDPFGHIWVLSNGEGNPNRLLQMIPTVDYHFQTRHGDWAWLAGTNPWSPPVTEMERGANTQVHCYLDGSFPRDYWGKLIVANWGAHGFASINHKIDLYSPDARGKIEDVSVFLSGADPMFRPTQLVPDADGNLYMLDWYGKDDENDLTGRIYKIVATTPAPAVEPLAVTGPPGTQFTDEQIKLVQNLSSPKSWERERAADKIVAEQNPAVMGALAMRLMPDTDPFTVSQVLWVLRRINTPLTTNMIANACKHQDARIRAMAVRFLRELNPADLETRVSVLSKSGDPEVAVEYALCQTGRERMSTLLGAISLAASDRRLRYQCAVELSRIMPEKEFVSYFEFTAADSLGTQLENVPWIMLDVALLENINPAARHVLTQLLENPGSHATQVMAIADRWATAQEIPALQSFIQKEIKSHEAGAAIASAFNILRRLGPDALSGLPVDALAAFFEQVRGGSIALPDRGDRIAAIKLLEGADSGKAGPAYALACLTDVDPEVRLQALRTIRLIGWQNPELFDAVSKRLGDKGLNPNERLTAIVTLGSQEKPDASMWKGLLASDSIDVVRTSLRVCKQFAGNDAVKAMLLEAAPGLLASHADLHDDLAAVLALFSVDAAKLEALTLNTHLTSRPAEEIEKDMLARAPHANARLGQDVFERVGCTACHDLAGKTAAAGFGPSLRDIGKGATPASLAESILFPSRVIKDGYETYVVRTKSGQELEGWLEQHGDEVIVVRGGTERVRVKAADIVERKKIDRSPMPDVSLEGMSIDEMSDLLAYLTSQGSQPAATKPAAASANRRPPRKKARG